MAKKIRKPSNLKGNPDFGQSIKKERVYEDPLSERISIRLTAAQKALLDRQPNSAEFARNAILDALKKIPPTVDGGTVEQTEQSIP